MTKLKHIHKIKGCAQHTFSIIALWLKHKQPTPINSHCVSQDSDSVDSFTESLQSSNNKKKRKWIAQKAQPPTYLGLLRHETHVYFLADPDVLRTVQLHVIEQVIWAI